MYNLLLYSGFGLLALGFILFLVLKDNNRNHDMLSTKLTVRGCQYRIAVEGLNHIVESNDPVGIAAKTLEAMNECMPKAEDLE